MPQAQASLSSPACSTFSRLVIVLTHKAKKRLHCTLNTLHPTLHITLTTHSKHAKCHKSLNSQNSLTPSLLLALFRRRASHNFPLFLSNQIMWFTK